MNALQLYRSMLHIRLVEERIAELYPEQEMRCPVHLCIGQEAVSAAACAALETRDYAMSGHRSHGHYLAKGGDLKAMLAEIYGKATGCAGGKGGSMHMIDLAAGFLGATPIVGSTIPIAVGAALGASMKKEDRVTMVFFGDGAVETGVFYESMNYAAVRKLPIVFVCENNLYSVYSPLTVRQPENRSIADMARGIGMESIAGDGNDVELVFKLCAEAVQKARTGGGPTFFEFSTYRWREHCGPDYDNHIGYRTEAEYLEWKKRCPITLYADKLLSEGRATQAELDGIRAGLEREIDAAALFARQSPFPDARSASTNIVAGRRSVP